MATPQDTVPEFCTTGEKTPFTAGQLLSGYTGSENDPAFSQQINDYFNKLGAAINTNAAATTSDIDALNTLVRDRLPAGLAYPWFRNGADPVPTGFAICDGSSFNPVTYPLLDVIFPSGFLPDTDERTLLGDNTTSGATGDGSNITHQHGVGTLITTDNSTPDHSHTAEGGDASAGSGGVFALNGSGSLSSDETQIDGRHTHDLSGSVASSGASWVTPRFLKVVWIIFLE